MYRVVLYEILGTVYHAINVTCKQDGINTRSSTLSLHVPYVKSFGQTSFYYTGVLAWNELPQHLQNVNLNV